MNAVIAWLFSTGDGHWSLASQRPTPANCHLAARGIPESALHAFPLGLDPGPRSTPSTPVAWAWRKAGMVSWAIGKVPPHNTDRVYVKHPEKFAEYEICGLHYLPPEMDHAST